MIRSYFKIAWRNLNKHRVFSVINIFGLAIGITAFCIIALYVGDELSFDRFNAKADRIFRVVQHGTWNGGKFDLAITSAPYAAALKNDYPQVEDAVRLNAEGGGKITYGEKHFDGNNILLADNSVFNIFTYHFLYGDAKTSLSRPQSIVLTETMANLIFGDAQSAINKSLVFDGSESDIVTGIIADLPANSQITFSALRAFPAGYSDGWGASDLTTYVLLKHPEDANVLEANSQQFFNKYLATDLGNVNYKWEFQPLKSVHLHSNLSYDYASNGNITYVYVFSIVGLLILFIAIINYVNLATARSSVRVKEIGVRKVIGSDRTQLMLLFFSESVLLTLLATAVAATAIHFSLPYFNQLSGKTLTLWQFGRALTVGGFVLFACIVGILSGLYPALFLSGFKTIPAMKGQMGNQASTVLFRKSLVVFQFVTTIVMITGSCVIYSQLHYVLNKDMGFNKNQILTFHIHSKDARAKADAIKGQLLQNPLIKSVAVAGNPIGNNDLGSGDFNLGIDGKAISGTKIVQNLITDEDFIPTMKIKIAQGRNFMKNSVTDKTDGVIINETLTKELGWKAPIGSRVISGMDNGKPVYKTIIGVIKDFNTYSLQHKVMPMVLSMPETAKDGDNFYVRISKNDVTNTLNYINKVYSTFDPEKPEFHFLDDNFAHQYQTEQKQGNLLLIFTVLAVSIACMGLFGLVTFTVQQRNTEIGIRKILGASMNNIVNLLSRDLIKLVIIATVISVPIAWWAMSLWLQDFAYRIHIQLWMFALASGLAILIALITVGFQSIKAAIANPVKSLRNE